MSDAGAVPLELALRAESGAHRANEKVDDLVQEQGKRNRRFSVQIDALEKDVARIWGAVGLMRWLIPVAATVGLGLAALVGKLVH